MSYFAPYIDSTGFHVPSYDDINTYLWNQNVSIYGQSVVNDISTTDLQSIAIYALLANDCMQLAQAIFNGMSPMTAIGVQQDSLYKLNGIARLPATPSTATLTVTGTPFFQMTNRVAQDANGNLWDLPTSFVIPSSGTIDVTATCETPGQVTAGPGTINVRNNPVAQWFTVTNATAANVGSLVEQDSAFRARQGLSVVLPSETLVNGTIAAIAAVPGVTRYGTIGVENPTGNVDSYGNPPHSISMVAEGGSDTDIANAIYLNKTPGGFTNGTTHVVVTDPITLQPMTISFFKINEPVGSGYVQIQVAIKVIPLSGYTTATATAIQTAIVSYLNSLQIGETVSYAAVLAVAMNVNNTLLNPTFSLNAALSTIGISGGTQGTTDVPITFNNVAQTNTSLVTVS
jgi:uncharacterized phage protein gp47/JayE